MRCINMKIIDVLLFSLNLMAVRSVTLPNNKTSQAVDNGNSNKFERDCPDLWKVIQSNNLVEWTNCQNKSQTDKLPTEEEVLEFACFAAKTMMVFICDNKLNITNDYMSSSDVQPICPFDFSQLIKLGNLTEELIHERHCERVCSDLYKTRIQCVILKRLNNYLKSYEAQSQRLGLVLPNEKKSSEITTSAQKADKIENKPVKSKMSQDGTTKGKMETTSNKGNTSPIRPASTDETKNPKSEKPDFEKPNLDIADVEKPESEKPQFEEKLKTSKTDEENNDNKADHFNVVEESDMLDSINPSKGEVDQLSDFQGGTGDDEVGKVQIHNQKEINSNDAFLQAEDSHFFFYFIMVSSIIVIGYIGFHNKNKILAYALEGTSGRRSRRRPNPARYRKLETNLEEAISSNASETVASSVVY